MSVLRDAQLRGAMPTLDIIDNDGNLKQLAPVVVSVQPIWANFGLLTLVLRSGYGYERTSSASLLNVRF